MHLDGGRVPFRVGAPLGAEGAKTCQVLFQNTANSFPKNC